MLNFFRKYQKIFFFVVAVVVISSFVFFGAFSAMTSGPQKVDPVIGKAVDGANVRLSEILCISRFIASDQDDIVSGSRNIAPNLLNNGVIRKDFIMNGLADVIVGSCHETLQQDLNEKLRRIKTYHPYEHPETPFLSAKAVWQRVLPEINAHFSFLQSEEEMNKTAFSHLATLYQLQSQLPPEWLRQILLMQEKQYHWLHPDPKLRQQDLGLFGFHSLADWFGRNFIDFCAEFIHNAAILAQNKGYKVSFDEAKIDLERNFLEAMRKIKLAKLGIEGSYKEQLRQLGMDETTAVQVWQKVLLFRKYFADLGASVLLDRMAYAEFGSVANEKVIADLYEWPAHLKFTSAYQLFSFQTYLDTVAGLGLGKELLLPTSFLPLQDIEKKAPELLTEDYQAKVYAVDKREVALKASCQEVWAMETEDATWSLLKKEFASLAGSFAKNPEERFAFIEKLESNERAKIDAFVRLLLVEQHKEWVKQALDNTQPQEKKLSLCAGKIAMPYFDEAERLAKLFAQIPTNPETALEELECFTTKTAFYRFENIEKLGLKRIKTYEEALQDGSLAKLVDRKLEKELPAAKPSFGEEKSKREFSELKEEVAEFCLKALTSRIASASKDIEGPLLAKRMVLVSKEAMSALKQDPNDPAWVKSEGEDPLFAQFKMTKTEQHISRTAKEDWMSKESFILQPNDWTSLHVDSDGSVMFMYMKTKQSVSEPVVEQLIAGKQVLSSDIQRILAEKILAVMQKKQALIIPLQPEQE